MRLFRNLLISSALLAFIPTIAAKPIPDLAFKDLAGHPQRLSSLRGSITVINFWATWCGPCRNELPRLAGLAHRYSANNVRFVAISVDEPKDQSKVAPYLSTNHIAIDAWLGADIDTLGRLHLGNVVPATIILDRDGTPIGRIEGEAQDTDITTYLDWLLSDRKAAPPKPLIKRF